MSDDGLDRLGPELEAQALAQHHLATAQDHRYLTEVAQIVGPYINPPSGTQTFVALSDPNHVSPLDVLNDELSLSTTTLSQGEGPVVLNSYVLQRGEVRIPNKPILCVDVASVWDADGTQRSVPVTTGVVGYAVFHRSTLATTGQAFAGLLQGSQAPSAAPGMAAFYTIITVSAYEMSVHVALRYTTTEGEDRVLTNDAFDVNEMLQSNFIMALEDLQQEVREAVEITAYPILP